MMVAMTQKRLKVVANVDALALSLSAQDLTSYHCSQDFRRRQ